MSEISYVNYVVTHKEYPIREEGMYRTLCVGKYRKEGLLSELDGENIAEYNDRINEATGLYWIWKNATAEYVGLSHYRRFFLNNRFFGDRTRLDEERAREILEEKKYDLILTEPKRFNYMVVENIAYSTGQELNLKAYELFRREIMEKQPEYLKAFDDAMTGRWMYLCNMFMARKEVADRYCEWLFSFLLDVADKLDVSGCTEKQRRAAGFYAECLWTVWLRNQEYQVYTLPYVMTE